MNLRNSFFDFADGLAAPDGDLRGVGKFILQQEFLGYFQAVASERRIFQFRINVAGIVVFAVAAKPEQSGDDELRAVSGACACNGFADGFQTRGQFRAVNGMGFDAIAGGLVGEIFAGELE